MYSRNRMEAGEEKYTGNIPPLYSGNRFSYPRREYDRSDRGRREEESVSSISSEYQTAQEKEEIAAEGISEPAIVDLPEQSERSGLLAGIGQEELLLIALLLLLSAEHERCMDVIVVLLLLIGIH